MKQINGLLFIFTIALCVVLSPPITLPQEKTTSWEVYFSPHGGCTDAIIRELDKAKTSVLVQAYSFTSAPIAKALLNAHKKGVNRLGDVVEFLHFTKVLSYDRSLLWLGRPD